MDNLPDILTIPPTSAHTHTIIFLHGRGDTAQHFAHTLAYSKTSNNLSLQQTFPSFRWVFPQSELRPLASSFGNTPVSQWFDVWNVKDFSEREDLQALGLRESVTAIRNLLAHEASVFGGQWDRIILAGISQGAATSIHTLLNLNLNTLPNGQIVQGPRKLAAFLGFSCRMPFPNRSLIETRNILGLDGVPEGNEVLCNTPILLEHCVDDPLVLLRNGYDLRETLRGFGAQVMWKEYPAGAHWFNSPAGMDDVVTFLHANVLGQVTRRAETPVSNEMSRSAMDLS